MATHVGERWGNYQLVRLLGQGGFAEVYLGEHVRLGMRAAIKILHSRLTGDDIASFQREAKTIADLAHPHIVRVWDFDVQQGVPFLVLEYAPNGSLRQKHPYRERVTLAQIVGYVQHITSALQYAHDCKLIHRDVKPENMLLNAQEQVVLSDFGIATLAHSTSSMQTQETTGTLAYMAPEQIHGKPRPASDQYALAVTVYQWLSGVLPFQGSSAELIAQHLAVMPAPLRQKAPDLPPEVDRVVLTALLKDPQERFGSVQAFANALTIASGQPPQAASPVAWLPAAPAAIPTPGVIAPTIPEQTRSVVRETPQPDALVLTKGMVTREPPSLEKKPPMREGKAWLIGILLCTLIGSIFASVLLISNHQNGTTKCQVGLNYDANNGQILGAADRFSSTTTGTVYLVCWVAPNVFLNGVSDQLIEADGSYPTTSGSLDSPHHVYTASYTSPVPADPAVFVGSYTWDLLDENSSGHPTSIASVSFQIT
jgi:serine/threonine protein kinase